LVGEAVPQKNEGRSGLANARKATGEQAQHREEGRVMTPYSAEPVR